MRSQSFGMCGEFTNRVMPCIYQDTSEAMAHTFRHTETRKQSLWNSVELSLIFNTLWCNLALKWANQCRLSGLSGLPCNTAKHLNVLRKTVFCKVKLGVCLSLHISPLSGLHYFYFSFSSGVLTSNCTGTEQTYSVNINNTLLPSSQ